MFYADVLDVLVIITATLFAALMLWRPLKEVAASGLKNTALATFISRALVALARRSAVLVLGRVVVIVVAAVAEQVGRL